MGQCDAGDEDGVGTLQCGKEEGGRGEGGGTGRGTYPMYRPVPDRGFTRYSQQAGRSKVRNGSQEEAATRLWAGGEAGAAPSERIFFIFIP